MRTLKEQQGMTFLGYVIVLGIIGFFAMIVLKLVPIYLEYQSVLTALNSVESQPATSSPASIRSSIQKNLDVNSVTVVNSRDFKVKRDKGTTRVHIAYNAETRFISNVYFLVKFDASVELGGT